LGLEDTDRKSRKTFLEFLSRPLFAVYFTAATAGDFYEEFRCGILHQAEVGGNSRIRSLGPIIRFEPGTMTVNRTAFHTLLKQEIANYEAELRDPKNATARDKFRKKMDFICKR
jgi:hypothetical protein